MVAVGSDLKTILLEGFFRNSHRGRPLRSGVRYRRNALGASESKRC
jgi:hypothetical protein